MFKGPRETEEFVRAFSPPDGVEAVIAPPFTSLREAVAGGATVFAQNVHWADEGAYTGEVSAAFLKELGVAGAIVGHSERRQYFGEDDALVNRKVKAALAGGLVPILCVGETLAHNERGETEAIVSRQVRGALDGVEHLSTIVVAYEPIWAIGTGRAATAEGANATIGLIRRTIAELAGSAVGDGLRVQYGGSVTPENFGAFIGQPEIDGALVGGASLKADQFIEIVRIAAESSN